MIRTIVTSFCILTNFLSCTLISNQIMDFRKAGTLIFEDNFDSLDNKTWHREFSNAAHIHEFQLFSDSDENTFVKDGILHLRPTLATDYEDTETLKNWITTTDYVQGTFHPIRGSRISTNRSFSFRYGYLEIRAKIPAGDWLFPALWLVPRASVYGSWPLSGEIDLMESRGNRHLTDWLGRAKGANLVGSTLHWGPRKNLDRYRLTTYDKRKSSGWFCDDFHVYGMKWTDEGFRFYVDDEIVGELLMETGGFYKLGSFPSNVPNPWKNRDKMAPFDQDYYIIINLAVGGTSFFLDSDINKGGKPWKNNSKNSSFDFWVNRNQWEPTWNRDTDDSHLQVDYVRVYSL